MNSNLKRIAIALAFVSLGTVGLTTTGQAKTIWHKGLPNAIKGTWVAPNGKNQKVGSLGKQYAFRITSKAIETLKTPKSPVYPGPKLAYHYHHKKGSKYYYVKSPKFKMSYGKYRAYTRFKVEGKKISISDYGEIYYEILNNGKRAQSYGKYQKVSNGQTVWYKK